MTSAQAQFKPIPDTPPALPGNPATPAKVKLGKMLYFDPRVSASHAISCNSCHNVGLGGVDVAEKSIGHTGSVVAETRRPSSTPYSTPLSSGMGEPRISRSRRVARWSIRTRCPRQRST